jgi:hypothetical protein
MEYKTILWPIDFESIAGSMKGKSSNDAFEAEAWNASLQKYARDGWTIKSAGPVMSGNSLVFWALLERPEKKEGF